MSLWSRKAEPDERLRLTYSEALRGITQQQQVLDDLRGRAGLLLSAAGISTSFLAALLDRDPSVLLIVGAALVAALFVAVVVLILKIFTPRQFVFRNDPHQLLDQWIGELRYSIDDFHRRLAFHLGNHYDSNQETIKRLQMFYVWACRCFGIEVILLVIVAGMEASRL